MDDLGNTIDPVYKRMMESISSESAKGMCEIFKIEIEKQKRSLVSSNSQTEDMIFKGGIRTLEKMIKLLDKRIFKHGE